MSLSRGLARCRAHRSAPLRAQREAGPLRHRHGPGGRRGVHDGAGRARAAGRPSDRLARSWLGDAAISYAVTCPCRWVTPSARCSSSSPTDGSASHARSWPGWPTSSTRSAGRWRATRCRGPPSRAGPGPSGVRRPGRPRAAQARRVHRAHGRGSGPTGSANSGDAGTASALDALAGQAERIRSMATRPAGAHPARGRSTRAASGGFPSRRRCGRRSPHCRSAEGISGGRAVPPDLEAPGRSSPARLDPFEPAGQRRALRPIGGACRSGGERTARSGRRRGRRARRTRGPGLAPVQADHQPAGHPRARRHRAGARRAHGRCDGWRRWPTRVGPARGPCSWSRFPPLVLTTRTSTGLRPAELRGGTRTRRSGALLQQDLRTGSAPLQGRWPTSHGKCGGDRLCAGGADARTELRPAGREQGCDERKVQGTGQWRPS